MSYGSMGDFFYSIKKLAENITLLEKFLYPKFKYCHICNYSLVCERCRIENIHLLHSKVCELCGMSVHDDEHCYDFEAQVCSTCSVN